MTINIGRVLIILSFVFLGGCSTEFQARGIDSQSGYLPTSLGSGMPVKKANVLADQKTDLGRYGGSLLVVGGDFFRQEAMDIGGFTDIFTVEDLQKRIIARGLQDKVPSVDDLIGLNKAYKEYKPFLFLRFKEDKGSDNNFYLKLIVTDPGSAQDIFVAQVKSCGSTFCDDDQHVWYPLFNSYIDWLRANGMTVSARPPSTANFGLDHG